MPLPISRADVVRELDRRLIEDVGLPSAVLMDQAAGEVCRHLLLRYDNPSVLILCGPGNNGGDGYALARHLASRGLQVRAVPVFPPRSPDCCLHAKVAEKLGLVAEAEGFSASLVVDAIFGTGQRAPVKIPAIPGWDEKIPLVALDVPTGIDADSGARVGSFPDPVWVLCIGRLKPFLFSMVVPWELCHIGLELRATDPPEAELWAPVDVPGFLPNDNKWSRGHVGILAGTPEKAGAAVLCARGALKGGAGLVTLAIDPSAWSRLTQLPPEVMLVEPSVLEQSRYDALVVGPGLGRASDTMVRRLWVDYPHPLVLDADGIRAIHNLKSDFPRLLTPHAGEAAALLEQPWPALEVDRLTTARQLSQWGAVIYKGVHPIVAVDGEPLSVFWGALPELGTGGLGDVLAGICGALAARFRPVDGAGMAMVGRLAVSLQLEAGRRLAGSVPTASEIAEGVGAQREATEKGSPRPSERGKRGAC